MAEETLVEDKEVAEGLDFNELKAVAKELNGVIDQYNATVEDDAKISKARIVGAKKLDMFIIWRDGVDALFDANFEGIPESSVNFYNDIYAESEDGDDTGAADAGEADAEAADAGEADAADSKDDGKKKDRGNLG